MAVTDPIYKINGIEARKSKIAEVAKGHNMTADEYITNFKGVLVPGKTTDSTVNANPNVESGNTELDGENGSSGSPESNDGITFGEPMDYDLTIQRVLKVQVEDLYS